MRWVTLAVGGAVFAANAGAAAEPLVDQIVREFPAADGAVTNGPVIDLDAVHSMDVELRPITDVTGVIEPASRRRNTPPATPDDCGCGAAQGTQSLVEAARACERAVLAAERARARLVQEELAEFDVETERYMRLIALTRRLEQERARQIEREFEAAVNRFLLERAFMHRMERQRRTPIGQDAGRAGPLPPDSADATPPAAPPPKR